LDWRRRGEKLEFLVKWRGYSQKHNTWEPIENLNQAAQEEARALLDEKNEDKLTTSATTSVSTDADQPGSISKDSNSAEQNSKRRSRRVSFDHSVPEQAPTRQPRSAEERDARAAQREERRQTRELEKLLRQI